MRAENNAVFCLRQGKVVEDSHIFICQNQSYLVLQNLPSPNELKNCPCEKLYITCGGIVCECVCVGLQRVD